MNNILHYYTDNLRLLCGRRNKNITPALGKENFKNSDKRKCKYCVAKMKNSELRKYLSQKDL